MRYPGDVSENGAATLNMFHDWRYTSLVYNNVDVFLPSDADSKMHVSMAYAQKCRDNTCVVCSYFGEQRLTPLTPDLLQGSHH